MSYFVLVLDDHFDDQFPSEIGGIFTTRKKAQNEINRINDLQKEKDARFKLFHEAQNQLKEQLQNEEKWTGRWINHPEHDKLFHDILKELAPRFKWEDWSIMKIIEITEIDKFVIED